MRSHRGFNVLHEGKGGAELKQKNHVKRDKSKKKNTVYTHAIDRIEYPNDIGFWIRVNETIHCDIVTHFRFHILWSFDEAWRIYTPTGHEHTQLYAAFIRGKPHVGRSMK